MTDTMTAAQFEEIVAQLRGAAEQWMQPPADMIGKLPKGNTQLDYLGHAAVTKILLEIDPFWSLDPVCDERGIPIIEKNEKNEWVMWGHLTVLGHTRMGAGSVSAGVFEREKQLISDLLRNTAMRFGIGTALWAKEEWAQPTSPDSAPNAVLPASDDQESRSPQKDKPKPPAATQKPFCTECGAEIQRGEKKQGKAGEWRHVECPSVAAVQEAFPGAQTVGTDKTEYDLNEEPF